MNDWKFVHRFGRRELIKLAGQACVSPAWLGWQVEPRKADSTHSPRFCFRSAGRVGIMKADGRELQYPVFDIPKQVSWQAYPLFSDGRRLLLVSSEDAKT